MSQETIAQMSAARQALTAATFVEIIDSLVEDFDVVELLGVLARRSTELTGASAAGILLADRDGALRVVAASSEQIEVLELFQIRNEEGPCLDCFTTGKVVIASELSSASQWPRFAAHSVAIGYSSLYAVPLRLRDQVLGCLNLFMADATVLSDADIALVRALADAATIAIVQDEQARASTVLVSQLEQALTSRLPIEQAKGMIAERGNVDMAKAFSRLRAFSRQTNHNLTVTAEMIIDGSIAIDVVARRRSSTRGASRQADRQ